MIEAQLEFQRLEAGNPRLSRSPGHRPGRHLLCWRPKSESMALIGTETWRMSAQLLRGSGVAMQYRARSSAFAAVVLASLLLQLCFLQSAAAASDAADSAAARHKLFLWRVTGGNGTIYLWAPGPKA